MKKFALIAFISIMVVGCSNSYKEANFPARPKELADCTIHILRNDSGDALTVVRCPNSNTSTTYHEGKSSRTVVVVDGIEYVKKD